MAGVTRSLVIFYAFGRISIAINGPILKHNLAIWSHWLLPTETMVLDRPQKSQHLKTDHRQCITEEEAALGRIKPKTKPKPKLQQFQKTKTPTTAKSANTKHKTMQSETQNNPTNQNCQKTQSINMVKYHQWSFCFMNETLEIYFRSLFVFIHQYHQVLNRNRAIYFKFFSDNVSQ